MVKNISLILRALVAVIAVGAFAVASGVLAGPAQAAKPPHVTLRVSAHTITTKGSVTFAASTSHPVPGEEVVLFGKRTGNWHVWYAFPHHRGGRIGVRDIAAGTVRLRAVVIAQGQVLDVSNVVVLHVHKPAPVKPPVKPVHQAAQVSHSCTQTSTGSCIRGGEFCPQASYGHTGYDAGGRAWTCTGDRTHPHWE